MPHPTAVTRPAVPWLSAFGRGMAAPWRGFKYLWHQPRLWLYGIIPVLLNLLISAFVLVLLIAAAVGFMVYLHPQFTPDWAGVLLEVVVAIALLLAAAALAFVAWLLLQGILVGHFLGLLAKRVELQLGTPEDQLRDIPWGYQIIDTFRDVTLLVAINVGTLFLHLIPGIGSVLALGISTYFDALLFGAEVFDYPLALRGMRRAEKWKFLRAHRPYTLGLGLITLVVGLIPLIGPIFLTTAAVGAVLLYHDLEPLSVVPAAVAGTSKNE